MSEEILNKEIAQSLLRVKGECRGLALREHLEYLLSREGPAGLKKLEEAITAAGYPFKYQDLKPMHFYPLGLEAILLLAAKKVFNYGDAEIEAMGAGNVRVSLVVRLFAKYLVSLEKIAGEAPKIWERYFTVGRVAPIKIDQVTRSASLRLEDFKLHPVECLSLKGYFSALAKLVLNQPVVCEETKCVFRGDPYHEFLIKW